MKTKTYTVPQWQGWLYISLFNGDGGDGFTEDEIKEANDFIEANSLYSLIEVEDAQDGETKCTFIINDKPDK